MAREQELNEKIDAITAKVGEIGTYVRGIADDLRNAHDQPAIDAAIGKLDALAGQVDQIIAEKAPDPTP